MKRPHRLLSIAVTAALGIAAAPAHADGPDATKVAQASSFFDAGAQAYKAGQYLVAAEAFLKAHEISPSSSLLFSAAQAYRRQFLTEPSAVTLHKAIGLYRDYLRQDKNPKRREDAMQALAALLPLETRFSFVEGPEPVREAAGPTRLLLSASAEGAEIAVDEGPFVPAPCVPKVTPDAHRVRVRAPGFEDEQLTVTAVEHELVPRHVVMRPKPARLRVAGPAGARVAVDGRLVATLPLAAPLAVDPGAHFVTVTLNGHQPFGQVLDLERDATRDLVAPLPPTRQRIAAWSTISVGAAGLLAGGVLTGLALARQSEAVSLNDMRAVAPLDPTKRDEYNSALAARDTFSRAAAVTSGLSLVAIVTGLGLYAIDKPEILPPSDDRLKTPAGPDPRVDFEIGALSLGVRGTF
jgi:hypothetical protein